MTFTQLAAWNAWLDTKPPGVRALAEQYPPGSRFKCHGKIMYAISYDELAEGTTSLGLTPTDPAVNYALAVAQKQPVCACCLPKLAALLIQP